MEQKKQLRILDFDIENRPLSYWIQDRPTAEVTAIASCWADDIGSMEVKLLGRDDPEEMLEFFIDRYNEADIVTGHYIRKHDLPIINGALLELGMPQLSEKLTSDTKMDMHKKADIPASQEYLSELFNLPADKVYMSQHSWRKANRLSPEGISAAQKRVSGDVYQHMMLRSYMVDHNLLKPAKVWRP